MNRRDIAITVFLMVLSAAFLGNVVRTVATDLWRAHRIRRDIVRVERAIARAGVRIVPFRSIAEIGKRPALASPAGYIPGGAYDPTDPTIYVRTGAKPPERLRILVHELAHHEQYLLNHDETHTAPELEVDAILATRRVLSSMGYDTATQDEASLTAAMAHRLYRGTRASDVHTIERAVLIALHVAS